MTHEILKPNGRIDKLHDTEYRRLVERREGENVLGNNGRVDLKGPERLRHLEGLREGEPALPKKLWEERMGYKDVHDKLARKEPTHKD